MAQTTFNTGLSQTAAEVRRNIRSGAHQGHTAGFAPGNLQCNIAILPERFALDFLRLCQRNPKPCPVVGVSDTGDPFLPTLGADIDIRTDVPRYRIFRDGMFSEETDEIAALWQDDFVTIALGCSFTFENALLRAGIPVRHIEAGHNVSMYRTNLSLVPAGPFSGEMVVSMRPLPTALVERASEICVRFPQAHGAPIAIGDPAAIGISDLSKPDFGDPVEIRKDEVPVFWACGVTPQNILLSAGVPICITHAPGCMLVSDVAEDAETPIFQPNKEI